MVLRSKKGVLFIAVFLIEIALIVAGLIYRQNFNRDFRLVSGKDFDKSAIFEIRFDRPSFPASFEEVEVLGFGVVSTGKVHKYKLKDTRTGKDLGVATVLDTVTRDREDPDNIKRLAFIVQLVLSDNPDRNIMFWVLKKAADFRSLSLGGNTEVLSDKQIAQIFPRGTLWTLIPLLDTGMEGLEQISEYSSYASRYYGGTIYPKIERLIKKSPDNHPLLGRASKPIFLLDIFMFYK